MRSMKRDLKSTNVTFKIVKYICCGWLFDEHKKKVDQKVQNWLSESILKLAVKKLHFEKTDFEIFMNQIFGKKLILKHFMRRIFPKGVF